MSTGIRRIGVIRTGRKSLIDNVVNGLTISRLHLEHIREGCAICIKHFVEPTSQTPEEFLAFAFANIDSQRANDGRTN